MNPTRFKKIFGFDYDGTSGLTPLQQEQYNRDRKRSIDRSIKSHIDILSISDLVCYVLLRIQFKLAVNKFGSYCLDKIDDLIRAIKQYKPVREYRKRARAYNKTLSDSKLNALTEDQLHELRCYHNGEIYFDKKCSYVIVNKVRYNLTTTKLTETFSPVCRVIINEDGKITPACGPEIKLGQFV